LPRWSGALLAVAPAEAAFFGTNGKLVFQSPSGDGIYTVNPTVNPDQTELTKIYDEPPGVPVRALPTWSPDGDRIAFASRASGSSQIHTMNADGSDVHQVTSGSESHAPAWSPDGTEIAFVRSTPPNLRKIKPDGTAETQIGPAGLQATDLAWGGSGGDQLAYTADNGGQLDIYWIFPSPTGQPNNLTANNPFTDDMSPEWKPPFGSDTSGVRLAFRTFRDSGAGVESALWTMAPNGTGQAPLVTGHDAVFGAWAPDRSLLAFSDGAGMLKLATDDGADVVSLGISGVTPDWQPIPRDITPPVRPTNLTAVAGDEQILVDWDHPEEGGGDVTFTVYRCQNPCGFFQPVAQVPESYYTDGPLPNGTTFSYMIGATDTAGNQGPFAQPQTATPMPTPYPRPKGATPMRVSLVPAVEACESPNRVHGPPLEHPSCTPPQPTSPNLTAGVGDGSPALARSIGFARLTVVGAAGDPDDSDVLVRVSITNVMKASDLSEYEGELRAVLGLRITDRLNPSSSYAGGTGSGTVSDSGFGFSLPCTPTPEPLDKSACQLVTSADAIAPGSVPEGARAVWQLDEVEVFDGGPDGDGDTLADNELFATQGVFVP
jgi:WD40-like Beta Propeller Repeat